MLVLAPGMELSQQAPTAQPRPVAWNTLLRPYGVTIRSDMAYDLLANEVIPLPTDFGRVLQVYPFFIRAQSTRSSPVNQDLGAVVLTWASTIDTTGAAKGTVTPLLGTSQATRHVHQHDHDRPDAGLPPDRPQAPASSRCR